MRVSRLLVQLLCLLFLLSLVQFQPQDRLNRRLLVLRLRCLLRNQHWPHPAQVIFHQRYLLYRCSRLLHQGSRQGDRQVNRLGSLRVNHHGNRLALQPIQQGNHQCNRQDAHPHNQQEIRLFLLASQQQCQLCHPQLLGPQHHPNRRLHQAQLQVSPRRICQHTLLADRPLNLLLCLVLHRQPPLRWLLLMMMELLPFKLSLLAEVQV